LAAVPAPQRALLQKVRSQIRAAAPGVEEYLGYGLLAFKLDGHPLIYLGAAKHHCALYGARADATLAEKLKGFKQSKGTIQFTEEQPLPAGLVREIVKARVVAHRARWSETAPKKAVRAPKGAARAPKKTATKVRPKAAATKSKRPR
jgi:uncharacterized protein YdhG (YjbR/CyaY superfamily)